MEPRKAEFSRKTVETDVRVEVALETPGLRAGLRRDVHEGHHRLRSYG